MKMNRRIRNFFLLAVGFSLVVTSCDLLETNKELSADDAKVEIRAAGDDIMYNITEMMESPSMESLLFLSEMMDMDIETMKQATPAADQAPRGAFMRYLSSFEPGSRHMPLPGVSRVLTITRSLPALTGKQDMPSGVFHYDFVTETFELVNDNVSYIELHYPANEEAFNAQTLNAVLRISNLEMSEVVYDADYPEDVESVPVKADVTMWIDGDEVMEFSYRVTLNDSGLPVSTTMSMDMPPYSMSMNLSGSNRDFTAIMSMKLDNATLISADLDFRYTADMEEVEDLDGYVRVTPLEFKGNIQPSELMWCEGDIDCANDNMDVEVFQTELDKKIGKLEFRMYYDEYWEEEVMELAIVYEDGSYEFLGEVFAEFQE